MTSSSPTSKRRRVAWLIGGLVLMGIGMMVWGSWAKLSARYYSWRIYHAETLREKRNYAKELSHFGQPAVEHLIALLETGNESDRVISIETLGQMGKAAQRAIPALYKVLDVDGTSYRPVKEYDDYGDSFPYGTLPDMAKQAINKIGFNQPDRLPTK